MTALDGARVLIVDDNAANLTLMAAVVRSMGIAAIETAADGAAGLAAVRREKPDLILLDVMMSGMDGYEMCRRVRELHPRTELPILFVTALDDPAERAACFDAGGTDMVGKPINIREVVARVGVHLENRVLLDSLGEYRQRLDRELAAARSTQQALLPDRDAVASAHRRSGLEVEGLVETSSELGGDFWTIFDAGPHRVGLLAADFTGHGVAAALNVFRLHAMMQRLPAGTVRPGALLAHLNAELHRLLPRGQFAAAVAAVADRRDGTLTLAGAAANAPVVVDGGGARPIDLAGPPLGAFADAEYDEHSLPLAPGSTLLIYSDALVEAMAGDRPAFPESDLLAWVAERGPGPGLAPAMLARYREVVPGDPPDDLTLVSLNVPER